MKNNTFNKGLNAIQSQNFDNGASNNKALLVGVGATVLGATQSFGAVTYDAATGFAGSLDLDPFYGAVGIAVTAVATVGMVLLGVKTIRSGTK